MASSLTHSMFAMLFVITSCLIAHHGGIANAQLFPNFYAQSCPNVEQIVLRTMRQAVANEPRMAASLLRLFFHDCFVQGCDGSVLLDDTATFTGEKGALPNKGSLRGFEVIDAIKANVEAACRATVSCADIVALAARDGVALLGGPVWSVPLGRRDATTASLTGANNELVPPFADLPLIISRFAAKGLDTRDMTALSGAHTIGQARCVTFRTRIYNDTDIAPRFAANRQFTCPLTGGDDNTAPIDISSSLRFDNGYYQNLLTRRGLFHSDQELFNGGSQDSLTEAYASNPGLFFRDFVNAMIKMENINVLTGTNGQIRLNCRAVNSA
ncbi:Peroxidase 4-like protein [Drosera capensis]